MKTTIEFIRGPITSPAVAYPSTETGACLEFSGVVRQMENGKPILGLFYEAYEPMARTQLAKIFQELAATHACDEILFVHRLDFVPVGEASLFIRIYSGHRQPGLRMMSELIDRLKSDVPVWKRTEL